MNKHPLFKLAVVILFTCLPDVVTAAGVEITKLCREHLVDPPGINVTQPLLSWQLASGRCGATRTACEILVASTRNGDMNSEGLLIQAGNLDPWFYQTLAGINYDPAQPGFKHVLLKPQPPGDLTTVKGHHDSLYGRIASEWKRAGGKFDWPITVPANSTATVYVPTTDAAGVTESGKPVPKVENVTFLRHEAGAAVYKAGSGSCQFHSMLSTWEITTRSASPTSMKINSHFCR